MKTKLLFAFLLLVCCMANAQKTRPTKDSVFYETHVDSMFGTIQYPVECDDFKGTIKGPACLVTTNYFEYHIDNATGWGYISWQRKPKKQAFIQIGKKYEPVFEQFIFEPFTK